MVQGPATVLVVEDEDDSREVLRSLLRDEGHRAVVAKNGRRALDVLRLFTPDLIVLDLQMPELDGWGFDRERARNPLLRDLPVIVVSAFDPDEVRLYELDARYFFRKPIDVPLFLRAVRSLLEGAELPPDDLKRVARDHLLSRNN